MRTPATKTIATHGIDDHGGKDRCCHLGPILRVVFAPDELVMVFIEQETQHGEDYDGEYRYDGAMWLSAGGRRQAWMGDGGAYQDQACMELTTGFMAGDSGRRVAGLNATDQAWFDIWAGVRTDLEIDSEFYAGVAVMMSLGEADAQSSPRPGRLTAANWPRILGSHDPQLLPVRRLGLGLSAAVRPQTVYPCIAGGG